MMSTKAPRSRLAGFLGRLCRAEQGLSVVEFALILPLFLSAGMMGVEVAQMSLINMRVSDIASAVADNASRMGQTDNSAITPTVSEAQIDSVLRGAELEGASFRLVPNGRVILSSLEVDPATGRQFIRWQRCRGSMAVTSRFGPAGYGLTGTAITGLGRTGAVVSASPDQAVMVAEVVYRYRPLLIGMFFNEMTFRQEAYFLVRDDRNLTGGGGTGVTGTAMNRCS